ncbi:MAG: HlyD family efflux transporter periplasmic adaptor subunit, partial [bacterium]|nr:HlyD family efflux transporter periplasmic adaptor subunit [bacterium]
RNAEANASLRAPISGVVTSLAMQRGEWASAGATIATIVNPAEVTLRVSLPADQTQRVQPGDAVQAGGITGHVWQVVHPLDPTTQMGQAIVTFDRTPSEPLGTVLPVTIRTGMHDHVLTVPATAVVQDPATGKYTIFVRDKNAGYTPVGVRVGWSSDGLQEVRAAGLQAGEKVATYGSYELLSSGG